MASPAPADAPNGMSTPPTTASGGANPSPPTASSTQANTQSQTQPAQSQLTNGQNASQSIPPSHPLSSLQDDGQSKRPRDARLMHVLLARMGVHAYTERVPLQLLDFAYRYTSGILSDAIAYEPPAHSATSSKKASKEEEGISLHALRTAVASRAANQFSPALPKEYMTEIATERNRMALPRVEREFGVRLPPERYCFTGVGWDLKDSWEEEIEEEEGEEGPAMSGGPVDGMARGMDTVMGGMDEEVDEDEFEDVMGVKGGDTSMADG